MGGLEDFVFWNVDLFCVDVILVCDIGNVVVGELVVMVSLCGMVNVVVYVEVLFNELYFGMFGGLVFDVFVVLVLMLVSLCDERGEIIIDGFWYD